MVKYIYIATIVLFSLGLLLLKSDLAPTENTAITEDLGFNKLEPVVVLELFTSQGCSSCPPADELLQQVKESYTDNVYALSYHVDYWNYIGWKDPYSQSRFTENQRRYNIKFGSRSNYTPQLVVNGQEHFVGSDASKMYSRIGAYQKAKPENSIRLSSTKNDNGKISFDYLVDGQTSDRRIRVLVVLDKRVTKVRRGENKNRILTNSNIVVGEKKIPLKTATGSVTMDMPKMVRAHEKINLIVLLEKENLDIVGASKLALEN